MTTNIMPPAEDKPPKCYNCGETESACKCPAEEPADLDAWRAEAGAALPYPSGDVLTNAMLERWTSAARTGWPRDAARVARLCALLAEAEARIATLEAAAAPTRDADADPCPGSRGW